MILHWTTRQPAAPERGAGSAALLVLLFVVMGLATRLLCADADGYSSFWPANAAMLVALLRLRLGLAATVVLGCVLGNLWLNRLSGLSTAEGILACVLNVLLVLLVAYPTRWFCGARTDLTRLRRQVSFSTIVFCATAVEAAIGVSVEHRFLGDPNDMLSDWVQWVLCDALGLVLATPAVLLLLGWLRPRRKASGPVIEPPVLMLLILLLTVVSFLSPRSFLFFFLYPAMVTLAFRARPAWALSTVLIVSILVSGFTAHGLGPIALWSPDGPLMRENMLQPYLWSLFLSALPANNALGEQRRSARRLAQMQGHLEYAATHDTLTGLATRQPFKARLENRLRAGTGGLLLFVDLDHFKQINDTLGHQAGDTVLRQFATRLATAARVRGGEAARFGGDEFALYLPSPSGGNDPGAESQDSRDRGTRDRDTLEAILAVAREPYPVAGFRPSLTVSIGAARLASDTGTVDELVRRADRALYAAKDGGRDAAQIFGEASRPPGHHSEARLGPPTAGDL